MCPETACEASLNLYLEIYPGHRVKNLDYIERGDNLPWLSDEEKDDKRLKADYDQDVKNDDDENVRRHETAGRTFLHQIRICTGVAH